MGWLSEGLSDWGISGKDIIGGLSSIYAANRAQKANTQAAQMVQDAAVRSAALQREGTQAAQSRLATLQQQGQPGVDYLRTVVAGNPATLTPAQQIAKERLARGMNARMAVGGLRGAGRTNAAIFKQTMGDFDANALEANQRRQDSGASALSNIATSATTNMATLDTGSGRAMADSATRAGEAAAGATTANAGVMAETMGNVIGSILARDDSRKTRYGREFN